MEKYSRYIFSDRHFWKVPKLAVKPDAFIVAPKDKASVYQTETLAEEEIWTIGKEIGTLRGKTVKGRGELNRETLNKAELDIEIDEATTIFPEYHRNIIGWGSKEKSEQMVKALILAENSAPYLYNL